MLEAQKLILSPVDGLSVVCLVDDDTAPEIRIVIDTDNSLKDRVGVHLISDFDDRYDFESRLFDALGEIFFILERSESERPGKIHKK